MPIKKTFDPSKATVAQLYAWGTAHALTPPAMPATADPSYETVLREWVVKAMDAAATKAASLPPPTHMMATRMLPVKLGPKVEPIMVEVRIVDRRFEGDKAQVLVTPMMGSGDCWIKESRLTDTASE